MIIFITGATAGFGAAVARRFAREGHRIVAAGRRRERLEALKKELGAPVWTVELDVRNREDVMKAFDFLPPDFTEVDVLVNNAGLALGLEPAPAASLDDWDTMVDTNVKGLMYCTRAALPGMVARNRGHIVNLGSVAALRADDIADAVFRVTTRPAHVNVNAIEIMPVAQAFNAFKIDRRT